MTWWDEQSDRRRAALSAVLDSARGQHCRDYAGGDRGFAAWLLVADLTCRRHIGVSIFDIADWPWRTAYDDGQAPGDGLRDALAADDTIAVLLGGLT